ncbi:MAG TPA: poly(R)-hydroxyalkanoic acid synthase subunit PhaE [Steroidobacteraceae bacterium]|nr:poly(R)-hydroxyalkanoic acid synthase subunit PhaE [Steroidobacteraceae bacterium]
MNNTSSKPNFIDAWLETQKSWLGRWQATAMEQRVDAMRAGMETWRQQFDPANPSAATLNVAHSFQTLLQSCMMQAGTQSSALGEAQNPLAELMQTFPLGAARERQLEWQAYLKALGEYQHRATQLMQQFVNVLAQSLQQVPIEVERRQHSNNPVQSMRELYDLWIECGEQCFASVAREEAFVTAQAAHTNALSQLRLAERALLERWLQQYDLPTRSELNSLHQKVRSMSERIAELEARLGAKKKSTRNKNKS